MKSLYKKIISIFLMKSAFRNARNVNLSEEEKIKGLERLIMFTEDNPVRNTEAARHNMQRSLGTLERLKLIHSIKPMYLLATIALLFTMGGGASFAANDSLPNDTLYPVKIHLNERVESALAFNEEAKAEVALDKAELRLQEAETLAVAEELDTELASKIEARFDKHINRLTALRHGFEEQGNASAAAQIDSRIEAMLEVHQAVLAQISSQLEEDKNNTEGVTSISAKVRKTIEASTKASAGSEEEEQSEEAGTEGEKNENRKQAAETLLKVAESKLERTEQFTERVGAKLKAEVSEDAEANLQEARELIAEGKAQMESENYQAAFLDFKASLRNTQTAHSLAATSIRLGVDLKARNNAGNDAEDGEDTDNDSTENETDIDAEVDVDADINTLNNVHINSGSRIKANARTRVGF